MRILTRCIIHIRLTELKNRIPNISDYVILGIDWINFGEPMPDCVLYNINEIKTEFKINDKFEKYQMSIY